MQVFSDGGTEHPTKILDVYTNSTRLMTTNARIFTYAVGKFNDHEHNFEFITLNSNGAYILLFIGPHPLPTVALKDMACKTGGSFTTITAMGAIRTKIQVRNQCSIEANFQHNCFSLKSRPFFIMLN